MQELSRPRRRNALACEACRNRRTKCDGARPKCAYCDKHHVQCIYPEALESRPSRLELDIAAIRGRLDRIESLLVLDRGASGYASSRGALPPFSRVEEQNSSPASHVPGSTDIGLTPVLPELDFPFMTIKTSATMAILGLNQDLAAWIYNMERADLSRTAPIGSSRIFVLQQQRAMSALAAFSDKVHIWYPILHPSYTSEFFHVITGSFAPSSNTCLALVVTAIGALAEQPSIVGAMADRPDAPYIDAALAMLPSVLAESSIRSLQCLVLLSVYYSCLVKPCQAHDYALIASAKAQNILKSGAYRDDQTILEMVRRSYWAVLLIESELNVQLDLAESGIWKLENDIPLPSSHATWRFVPDSMSTPPSATSQERFEPTGSTPEEILSYFLAEIAMRRLLQRCTTSVSDTSNGRLVYAPIIATELEHQLEEWYSYLPEFLQFEKNAVLEPSSNPSPLAQFLRVQYMAYKASIYWPAAHQLMEFDASSTDLIPYCAKFFESYVSVVATASYVVYHCPANVWTICASVFIITKAAIRVANSPPPQSFLTVQLGQSFEMAAAMLGDMSACSPSLSALHSLIREYRPERG